MAALQRRPGVGRQRQESRRGRISIEGATLSPAACDKSKVEATEFRPFRILFELDDFKMKAYVSY
jgi:hypothetical protein